MSHYFSEKQEVKSDRKIIKYEIEKESYLMTLLTLSYNLNSSFIYIPKN